MILVIGATGNIGRHVVNTLSEKDIAIRAVSRDQSRALSLLPNDVEIVEADLTLIDDVQRVLDGVSKVYLATNGQDQVEAETNVIKALEKKDIEHLVKISVIGASHDHFVQVAQAHAVIEETLEQTDIPYTILRPNWFAENFLGSAPAIMQQGAIYGSAGEGKVAFIDSRDIADAAVAVLTDKQHIGKEYQLTGPHALTFADAAEELSEGLGVSVSYVNLPEADYADALINNGLPQSIVDLLLQIDRNAREGNLSEVTLDVETLTGHAPRTLKKFARDYASTFKQ